MKSRNRSGLDHQLIIKEMQGVMTNRKEARVTLGFIIIGLMER